MFYFNSKFQTRRFFSWKYLGIQTSVFRVGLTVQSLSGNWTATKTFFFNFFSEKSPPSWFKKIIVYYRSEAIRWQIKSPLLICGFDFFFFLKPTRKRRAQGKSCKELFQNLWKSLRAIKNKNKNQNQKHFRVQKAGLHISVFFLENTT